MTKLWRAIKEWHWKNDHEWRYAVGAAMMLFVIIIIVLVIVLVRVFL